MQYDEFIGIRVTAEQKRMFLAACNSNEDKLSAIFRESAILGLEVKLHETISGKYFIASWRNDTQCWRIRTSNAANKTVSTERKITERNEAEEMVKFLDKGHEAYL